MRAAALLCKFATIAPRPRRRPSNGLQTTSGRPRLQKIGGVRGWRGCRANYRGGGGGGGVAAGLINRSGRLAASVNVSGGRGHSAPPPPAGVPAPLRAFIKATLTERKRICGVAAFKSSSLFSSLDSLPCRSSQPANRGQRGGVFQFSEANEKSLSERWMKKKQP